MGKRARTITLTPAADLIVGARRGGNESYSAAVSRLLERLDVVEETLRLLGLARMAPVPIPADPPPETPGLTKAEAALHVTLAMPVDRLPVSGRIARAMARLNIKTVGQLVQHDKSYFMACPNFGHASWTELQLVVAGMGLRFGMDV